MLADPVCCRFPGGESIGDVLKRLTPTLIEMEQQMQPVLVLAPLSVLQVLYCHYSQKPVAGAMNVKLPIHTVLEIRPDGGNFTERLLRQDQL